ncbi:MAG: HD domain-containing protein [Bacteroidales bacterium]|nr:HD domain-containing protein [Bacteroidales bacterium]MBQ2447566.1 HD domain-containing protein [Bacteroidales bacterium]
MVISRALDLAEFYPVDKEMIYVSAAYHDLGLVAGRENHHLVSGEILRNDARLLEWFSASQIETMAQAAEDHRASAQREPRSIYGKIIAEADRLIDPILVIERTLQYGHKHYPQLSKEEHFNRAIQHLHEKYGPQGYLKLWIPESPNAVALKELHALMADDAKLRAIMESLF